MVATNATSAFFLSDCKRSQIPTGDRKGRVGIFWRLQRKVQLNRHGIDRRMTFDERLADIERAEVEFREKLSTLIGANSPIAVADLFAIGAARRFLALSSGFRSLASQKNFPSCAGLLRMQIDNAARMNALRIVPNMFEFCEALLNGQQFNQLKDADGKSLTDGHLIKVLTTDYPWVAKVYKTTSGDIHLSMNAFYSSISDVGEDGSFSFYVGVDNPSHTDEDFFSLTDAFFRATQMSGALVLGYFTLRHSALSAAPSK